MIIVLEGLQLEVRPDMLEYRYVMDKGEELVEEVQWHQVEIKV